MLTSITRASRPERIELGSILAMLRKDRSRQTKRGGQKLRVLLVDDSIKSGKSLRHAFDMVQTIAKTHGQVEVRTAVLVNYDGEPKKAIEPDYFLNDCCSYVKFPYGPI